MIFINFYVMEFRKLDDSGPFFSTFFGLFSHFWTVTFFFGEKASVEKEAKKEYTCKKKFTAFHDEQR